jgi:hypothetical protein
MPLEDVALGWIISKLFAPSGQTASPGAFFPPAGGGAPSTAPPATTPASTTPQPSFPAQVPVPASAPPSPTTTTAPQPGNVAPAGFKRAVEMWIIQPNLAQQGQGLISGMGPQVGAMALSALQAQFPKGWQRAKSATAQEQAFAKSLLPGWHDGKVQFTGSTLTNARAWQYTKHPGTPATTAPPAAQPPAAAPPATTPASTTAPPDFPAAVPVPATAPPAPTTGPVVTTRPDGSKVTTLPEVLITADPAAAAAQAADQPAAAKPVNQITAVRKGEGLANVARRLGKPATAASAKELQAANVPGPDGWFSAQPLDKGGLKKKGRAGGLQPGDRLFVPPQWGPVNAAVL